MAHRKTAIAIPAELLEAVDEAARERGESRSAFISRVLRLAVRARRNSEITRRLNAVFADEALAEAQRREASEVGEIAAFGEDERW